MSDEPDNLNPRPVSPTGSGPPRDPPAKDEDGGGAEIPAVSGEDRALAASLAELAPAPANLNRDALMFAAGAESRRWVIRLWQLTAGILAAVGFAAGARMYFRPPSVVERVVYIQPPSATDPIRPGPPSAPDTVPAVPRTPPEPPATEPEPSGNVTFTTGDPRRWLQVRDDVLSAGVGMIPDNGRQPAPARNIALDQPAPLPRGVFTDPK